MADVRIDKMTLKLSGLSKPDAERLARRIAGGLAELNFDARRERIVRVSARVRAQQTGDADAWADVVIAELVRALKGAI